MDDEELIQFIRKLGIWTPPVTIAFSFCINWHEARERCKALVAQGKLRARFGRYKVAA